MKTIKTWLNNLTIKVKLTAGFAVVIALVVFLSAFALSGFNLVIDTFHEKDSVSQMKRQALESQLAQRQYETSGSGETLGEAQSALSAIGTQAAALPESVDGTDILSLLDHYQSSLQTFAQAHRQQQSALAAIEQASSTANDSMQQLTDVIRNELALRISLYNDSELASLYDQYQMAVNLDRSLKESHITWLRFIGSGENVPADVLLSSIETLSGQAENLDANMTIGQALQPLQAVVTDLDLFGNSLAAVASTTGEQQRVKAEVREYDQQLQQSLTAWERRMGETVDTADQRFLSGVSLFGLAILISSTLIALVTVRSVNKPIRDLMRFMTALGQGDLSRQVDVQREDEIGQLFHASQQTSDNLKALVGQLSQGIDQLSDTSAAMADHARRSHRFLSEQKLETDQVATATQEMSVSINEVASHAEEAAEAVGECDRQTETGGQRINRTIELSCDLADNVTKARGQIQSLKEESDQIDAIIVLISDVAQQTNLLALNAAIESARAGEAGRGFSVVADEVRNLSLRTQEATEKVNRLVRQLQAKATEALTQMNDNATLADECKAEAMEAQSSFEHIRNAVAVIQSMNQQIATAVTEQSHVAEDISQRLILIQDASDHALSASEQSLGATEDLNRLGSELYQGAHRFVFR